MALLIEHTVDITADVTDAVVTAYTTRRERVGTMPLGELVAGVMPADLAQLDVIVAADLRVAEVVAAEGVALEQLAGPAWTLAGRGWDLVVLVPSERLGDAHASLRTAPCVLQPWWIDEATVRFGAMETP